MIAAIRLGIAILVFFVQSSIGLAICGCPQTLRSVDLPKHDQKCPMGMKTCCACCSHTPPNSHAKKAMVKVNGPIKCAAKLTSGVHLDWLTSVLSLSLDLDQPATSIGLDYSYVPETACHPHLIVVPRTRPPNCGEHSLRAPPALRI